jgi:SAM-dependent methyltransferase
VHVLSEAPSVSFVDRWFEIATEDHFWFEWRLRATLDLLRSLGISLEQNWRALEVGCGRGVLLAQLERVTRWVIDGADRDRDALAQARPGRGSLYAYEIHDRCAELREAYDVLILYDVLEHIHDRGPFLRSALHHLRPRGLLMVNVPALQALYGPYDEAAGHLLRYNRSSLSGELAGLNMEILEMRYWGFSMVPVAWLRKFVMPLARDPARTIERGFQPPGRLSEGALRLAMRCERFLLKRPPLGTSLLLVAAKRE